MNGFASQKELKVCKVETYDRKSVQVKKGVGSPKPEVTGYR
jgi:hypothetical protein